jgi:Tfp pilus assembly protein PilF
LLIKKLDSTTERISDVIASKIFLNLGIIASTQDRPSESVHFLERALDYLLRECPSEVHENVLNIYILLGVSQTRKGDLDAAADCYQKALTICISLHGENSEETA